MQRDHEHIIITAYEEHADAIFRHCLLRVSDRDLARDLTQETFVRVLNYLQKGKSIENMRAFLFKIANNLIIDNSRKRKAISLDYLQEKGLVFRQHTKDNALHEHIDAADVIRRIEQLDEKYKAVLLLRYVDDLSPKEIAEITGENENTVSVRIHRGLEHVRKSYEPPKHQ